MDSFTREPESVFPPKHGTAKDSALQPQIKARLPGTNKGRTVSASQAKLFNPPVWPLAFRSSRRYTAFQLFTSSAFVA